MAEVIDSNIDTFLLELTDSAKIDSILINNQSADYIHYDDLIRIPLTEPVSAGSQLTVAVYYKLSDSDPTINKGISTEITTLGKSVTWTLSEPFYSKNWFPCKQVLDDKADSLYLFFTVADSLMVGSNGLLTAISDMPDGKKRYEWKSYYPTTYYLISFSVADYLDYSFYAKIDDTDSILVQNYVYNDSSFFTSNKELIDVTGDLLKAYHETYGPYPFSREKYGHCIAPIGGGMEHQTMTTLGNFGFILVAHELAHQWFGDNVTCQNWQDIWLNEGFASYSEYIALEKLRTEQELGAWLSEAFNLIVSQPDGSIFVPASDSTNSSRIFNYRLSYRKGAYILHMLRHELGSDELFFDVLRTYQEQYKDDVANINDFMNVLENVSQKNFDTFFNQWYFGEGYPILNIYWNQQHDTVSIRIEQEATAPSVTPFFNLLIDFRIDYLGGDTLIQLRHSTPGKILKFVLNKKVYQIIPNPNQKLLVEIGVIIQERDSDSTSRFAVFPNPSTNEVFIENYDLGLPFVVKLYDSNGALIDQTEGSNAFVTFDVSALASGIYQIVVNRDEYHESYKITKL
jgi:aminopeptidase N